MPEQARNQSTQITKAPTGYTEQAQYLFFQNKFVIRIISISIHTDMLSKIILRVYT